MPQSEAKRRATAAYHKRQDNIMIRPNKTEGGYIRQAAADMGMSVQAYILSVLRENAAYQAAKKSQENDEKDL